jgi:hypothetical protein
MIGSASIVAHATHGVTHATASRAATVPMLRKGCRRVQNDRKTKYCNSCHLHLS